MLTGVEPGEKVLTLSTEAGTAVTGNLLVGPDYLINTYKLTTPQIEGIFNMVKDKLGQSFYDTYVAQYEHLMYLNSGTVNNKYFWGLSQSDVEKCVYDLDGTEDCVVRNLSGNQFINNWEVKTNKAFLVSDVHDVITLNVINHDVNHDGRVDATDITDLIDFMLGIDGPACPFCSDINEDGRVDAQDLTDLIDYLLSDPNYHPVDPDEGD